MAGGTYTVGEEKIRPGTYINVGNSSSQGSTASTKGVVVMPLLNHTWGPVGEFFPIFSSDQDGQYSKLGYKMIDDKSLLLRETFKNAKTIILYKPNGGNNANVTVGNLTVEAKYPGTLGNSLKVVISDSVISGKVITIYKGTEKVYTVDGAVNVTDLTNSDWVNFTGIGALSNTSGANLVGGTDTAMVNSDVTTFLDNVETQKFNVLLFPLSDVTLLNAFKAKLKYFNYDIGKHVRGVCSGYASDLEFITNVTVGVKLNDGTILSAIQAAAWVAGASAAATEYQDLTYIVYDGAIDTVPRLKDAEIKTGLKNGEFLFTFDGTNVIVEDDINSLITFTTDKSKDYSSNRFIRAIQEFQMRSQQLLVPNKYDTDDDGQNLAKQDLIDILENMEDEKALKNVDAEKDVIITKVEGESIYIQVALQPNRSAKKYYIDVKTS